MKAKPEDVNQCSGGTGGSLQKNRLSFRNSHRLKLKTSGGLLIVLEESMEEYTHMKDGKIRRCQPMLGEKRQLVTDEPVEFEK